MLDKIENYILLTKPGIVLGNLISAGAGFFLASRGQVDGPVLLATLIGISLVVASGCVFNNCIDRDIDRKMTRTRNRAIAKGVVSPEVAGLYAAILASAGLATLWMATNLLCVAIVSAGLVIYEGIYSLYMKRNSIYAALVGSLAGATPPLAGYCAVTGSLDLAGLILFSMFSLWQMPHCYAIALYRYDDYRAAAMPILPIRRGTAVTIRHMIGYIIAFTAVTLTLTLTGHTGYGTFVVAIVLGVAWIYMALSAHTAPDERLWAKRLVIFSVLAIFILSAVISIDFAPTGAAEVVASCGR